MPIYQFNGTDQTGAPSQGTFEAPNEEQALAQLAQYGLNVTQVVPVGSPTPSPSPAAPQEPVSDAKPEKAKKLYSLAFKKLNEVYKSDKKNPDVLNYMGFTSRKIGNFKEAEDFYLKGLNLDPKHNGINEYLGELYVQTNRIEKAKERLEILKNCNCDEFQDLELIIKTKGTKIY